MSGGGGGCVRKKWFLVYYFGSYLCCFCIINFFCFSAENANAGHKVPNEESLYPQQWRGNLTVYERQNRGEVCN